MNLFKRIWNYFFPEKKKIIMPKIYIDGKLQTESKDYTEYPNEKIEWIAESKTIEQKVEQKPHTQLFRKHQLQGKVYRLGKSRFRIKKKIGQAGEKLKYHIELI